MLGHSVRDYYNRTQQSIVTLQHSKQMVTLGHSNFSIITLGHSKWDNYTRT